MCLNKLFLVTSQRKGMKLSSQPYHKLWPVKFLFFKTPHRFKRNKLNDFDVEAV